MAQVAEFLEQRGDRNAADFLIHVAHQLAEALGLSSSTLTSSTLPNSESQLSFFLQVLLITADNNGNPQVVYPLLQENLDQLDDNFAQVLRSWASATLPEVEPKQAYRIAVAIGNFSELIRKFQQGNRSCNLEIAITGYEVVATVFTRGAFTPDWATLQNSLGVAYLERIRGEKAQNLEAAISYFFAALEVYTHETFAEQWAGTQNKLGIAYLERIRGERAENLEAAIGCFSTALQVYTCEAFPERWADIQSNLGIAYRERIHGERAQNLELALHCYEVALEETSREAFPQDWGMTQNNLGNAYRVRIRGEKAENLELALRCYESALEVCTREAFPEQWAMTQNNLGVAYRNRLRGEKAQNLESAIHCYEAALEVYTCQAFSEQWAMTQNNLGNTYGEHIQGERVQNLESAIRCYEAALEVYTRQAFPEQWAMTQNNLGVAYSDRILGDRAQNLELAIRCYKAALEVTTRQAFPQDWAETQNNLGNAYRERIQGERAQNLESAIRCFEAALQVYSRQGFPELWATTQINLGTAYYDRILGERAQNLELAIRCYEAALETATREAFPKLWAMSQNNLGSAYLYRIWGERIQNLEAAICFFCAALQVQTCEAFPQNHAEAQFNLGLAYQYAQQFPNAYNAFASAIETVESLRGEIVSGDEVKQKLAEQWHQLYQHMVEVCLELHNCAKAIEYVERSKARNLVELLTTRDLYPKGDVPEAVLNELNRLHREIAAEQRRIDIAKSNQTGRGILSDERSQFSSNSPTVGGDSDRIRVNALQQQLNDLITQQIQPIDPTFSLTQRVEPISFQQIQELLPDDKTVLIEWYILDETFLAFIITHQSPGITVWQSSPEDGRDLINWIIEYLQNYAQPSKEHWKDKLESRLNRLTQIMHLEEVLTHIPNTCNRVILIPHQFLHLFPLHALPLPNQKDKCLLDKFPRGVRYAPSCQLLQLTGKQERPDFSYLFGIQNPTQDLFYANLEVQTVRRFFERAYVLIEENAKKGTLSTVANTEHLRAAHCAHFSCHGTFNFESPLKSALILADKEPLTLGEIFALTLSKCRLVTLSACETGLTDPRSISDEYISLPSGFL
jgi:CHAT domain-containing protein/TPR repeat protein